MKRLQYHGDNITRYFTLCTYVYCRMNTYKSFFAENFALISSASPAEPDPNALLHRETLNQYSFFGSVM
jgi:hypothetical protein